MSDQSPKIIDFPNPQVYKLENFPGINESLIREKFAEGDIDYLISLFDFIQRCKHRAEMLAQVYWTQMQSDQRRMKGETLLGLDTSRARNQIAATRAKQTATPHDGKTLKDMQGGIDL